MHISVQVLEDYIILRKFLGISFSVSGVFELDERSGPILGGATLDTIHHVTEGLIKGIWRTPPYLLLPI